VTAHDGVLRRERQGSPDRLRKGGSVTDAVAPDFRSIIGHRIEAAHELLAARWLERLQQLVPVAAHDIFPGEQLLGHAPTLIRALAAFLHAPATQSIAANAIVTARARELGQLRHEQRASVHQVLREYRVLRLVLAEFIEDQVTALRLEPEPADLIGLMNALEAAVDVLLQTTIETFVSQYTEAITQHTARLEGFNRMVTHELRQPLNTLQFALRLLASEAAWDDAAKRKRILATAERNVIGMTETLGQLVTLARSGSGADSALVQRVDLGALARAVVDQLRDMADDRGVELRVVPPLPEATIDVARVELVLVNLVSNAIKYSDPAKPLRMVEIACLDSGAGDCTLVVRDNGIGIAESDLRSIFGRFYRGHSERDRELGTTGLGLGLSIVADCVTELKGDIRVESSLGQGTTFFLELPLAPAA
jgi:signal transduction histidine kinase